MSFLVQVPKLISDSDLVCHDMHSYIVRLSKAYRCCKKGDRGRIILYPFKSFSIFVADVGHNRYNNKYGSNHANIEEIYAGKPIKIYITEGYK